MMECRKEIKITVTRKPWGTSGWIKGEVLDGRPEDGGK